MVPKKVVVRVFGGSAAVRFAVGSNEKVVYITDRQGVDEARDGRDTMRIIGFHKSDVFCPNRAQSIRDGDFPDWKALKPWPIAE